jgi:N-dimethylarginine dimethylaminohydrolase
MDFSTPSEFLPIKSMAVKHARDSFLDDAFIASQYEDLGFVTPPSFEASVNEYEGFRDVLLQHGITLLELPSSAPEATMDSIYARDASVVCEKGVILCNMGKPQRREEPELQKQFFGDAGIPVVGQIQGYGRLEGGDVAWLDEETLVVGRSYRTNDEGIKQLENLLGTSARVVVVELPHWKGPQDVFHLMSVFSPIDRDLAAVYSPLLPIPFRELLIHRGIRLVEVPESEFESMGCNILTLSPRKCLMVAGNPKTRRGLEEAGATVEEFVGEHICLPGGGGPTCLTRPLVRT